MISEKLLASANDRREQLIKKKPGLCHYQDEIDTVLDKTVTDDSRLEAISLILHAKLKEMNEIGLIPLKQILDDLER